MRVYRDRALSIEPASQQPVRDVSIDSPAGFSAAPRPPQSHSVAFMFSDSRIVHWTTRKNVLELTELSVTHTLSSNYLRLRFPGDLIPGAAAFVEPVGPGQDLLRVLAATSSSLHRLDFVIPGDPVRESESVFARVSVAELNHPAHHMFHPFRGALGTLMHCFNPDSIVVGCTNGAVFAVVFGHPDATVELREATVMQRIWAGLVPGRSSAASTAAVTALDVWDADGTPLVGAAYTDGVLRVWSVPKRAVLTTFSLSSLLARGAGSPGAEPPTPGGSAPPFPEAGHCRTLRYARFGSGRTAASCLVLALRAGVHVLAGASGAHLSPALQLGLPVDCDRVLDVMVSPGADTLVLWTLWGGSRGQTACTRTEVQWDGERAVIVGQGELALWTDRAPDAEALATAADPETAAVRYLMAPGRFAPRVVAAAARALQQAAGGVGASGEPPATAEALLAEVRAAVQAMLPEMGHAVHAAWARLLAEVSLRHRIEHAITSLMSLPHGDAAVVSRGSIGVLTAADAAETLHAVLERAASAPDPAEAVLARAATHAGLDDRVGALLGCGRACSALDAIRSDLTLGGGGGGGDAVPPSFLPVRLSALVTERVRPCLTALEEELAVCVDPPRAATLALNWLAAASSAVPPQPDRLAALRDFPRQAARLLARVGDVDSAARTLLSLCTDGIVERSGEHAGPSSSAAAGARAEGVWDALVAGAVRRAVVARYEVMRALALTLLYMHRVRPPVQQAVSHETLSLVLDTTQSLFALKWLADTPLYCEPVAGDDAAAPSPLPLFADLAPGPRHSPSDPVALLVRCAPPDMATLASTPMVSARLAAATEHALSCLWIVRKEDDPAAAAAAASLNGTDVAVLVAARLIQSGAAVAAQQFIRLSAIARAPRALVLAVCAANLGWFDKAHDWFVEAAAGAEHGDRSVRRFASRSGASVSPVIAFFFSAIQLLESRRQSSTVLRLARRALRDQPSDDDASLLWLQVFRHALAAEQYEVACLAAASNVSSERRDDCLQQLVIVLCDEHKVHVLSALPLGDRAVFVENVLEEQARASDPLGEPNLYEAAYAFSVGRANFRQAGRLMLECAQRLATDPRIDTAPAMRRQHAAYLAALTALRTCAAESAWDVRRDVAAGAATKRTVSGEPVPSHDPAAAIVVTDLATIEREMAAAAVRVRLLDALGPGPDPTAVHLLAQRSPPELVLAAAHAGFYLTAARLAVTLDAGIGLVAEPLARCCLALERDPAALFVDEDNPGAVPAPGQAAAPAWSLLRSLLQRFDGVSNNYAAHVATAQTLLSASLGALPSWLHTVLMEHNVSALVRLYLRFGLTAQAAHTAARALEAAAEARAAAAPGALLTPYVLDQVVAAVDGAGPALAAAARLLHRALQRWQQVHRLEAHAARPALADDRPPVRSIFGAGGDAAWSQAPLRMVL